MRMTWPWVAGFFEGEGCITWYTGKKKGTAGRGAVVTIGQKDQTSLVLIQKFLRQEGIEAARLYWRKPYKSKHRRVVTGCWILQLTRKGENQLFLRRILPYLVSKRQKAIEVLRLQKTQRRGRLNKNDIGVLLHLWDRNTRVEVIATVLGVGPQRVRDVAHQNGRRTGKRCDKCTNSAFLPSGQGAFWL